MSVQSVSINGNGSKHNVQISWGLVAEALILGLLIGGGISTCGKHIGEGLKSLTVNVIVKQTTE